MGYLNETDDVLHGFVNFEHKIDENQVFEVEFASNINIWFAGRGTSSPATVYIDVNNNPFVYRTTYDDKMVRLRTKEKGKYRYKYLRKGQVKCIDTKGGVSIRLVKPKTDKCWIGINID